MSQLPRISIVTPSFEQEQYLKQAIESVLSQGYLNLDYIIIDGGSPKNGIGMLRDRERRF